MKKLLLLLIPTAFFFTSFSQATDSLLYELESDTVKSEKSHDEVNVNIGNKGFSIEFKVTDSTKKEEISDTIRIRLGKKKFIIVEDQKYNHDFDYKDDFFDDDDDDEVNKKFRGNWTGLVFGINNYVNSDYKTDLDPSAEYLELNTNKSWEIGLNFAQIDFNIIENRLGLVSGLNVNWNNYSFDKNITLVNDENSISSITDSVHDFSKNKLTTSHLMVPLLLEFQIPTNSKDKAIHLNAGIFGSLKLGSHTKQIFEDNNKKYKEKVHEDFHLSPFTYGYQASIGYGSLSIFGKYTATSLFENGEGPELYPITIGIIIGIND